MAKKKGGPKGAPVKASRWTVRGVPAALQKAAGDLARARGQTLGQWLTQTVEQALDAAPEPSPSAVVPWRQTIEARLARLEATLQRDTESVVDDVGDAPPRSRRRPSKREQAIPT